MCPAFLCVLQWKVFSKNSCSGNVLAREIEYRRRLAEAKQQDKKAEAEELKKVSKIMRTIAAKVQSGKASVVKMPSLPRRRTNKADGAVARLGTSPLANHLRGVYTPDNDDWRDQRDVPFGRSSFLLALAAAWAPGNVSEDSLDLMMVLNSRQVAYVSAKVSAFVTCWFLNVPFLAVSVHGSVCYDFACTSSLLPKVTLFHV